MGVERGQRQHRGRSLLLGREVAAGPWLGCLSAFFAQDRKVEIHRDACLPKGLFVTLPERRAVRQLGNVGYEAAVLFAPEDVHFVAWHSLIPRSPVSLHCSYELSVPGRELDSLALCALKTPTT